MCVALDFKASPPPPQPPAIDNISICSKGFNISWKGAARMLLTAPAALHPPPQLHLGSHLFFIPRPALFFLPFPE